MVRIRLPGAYSIPEKGELPPSCSSGIPLIKGARATRERSAIEVRYNFIEEKYEKIIGVKCFRSNLQIVDLLTEVLGKDKLLKELLIDYYSFLSIKKFLARVLSVKNNC